jgi:hypothetical protein
LQQATRDRTLLPAVVGTCPESAHRVPIPGRPRPLPLPRAGASRATSDAISSVNSTNWAGVDAGSMPRHAVGTVFALR